MGSILGLSGLFLILMIKSQFDTSENKLIGFSSHELQFARLVDQSSDIHNELCVGTVYLDSETQMISCRILKTNNERTRFPPFCYVVEVRRSPIVDRDTRLSNENDSISFGRRKTSYQECTKYH